MTMSERYVYLLVELTVKEGKAAEFESLARAMTSGSQKEAGTVGYEFALSADGKRCRLLETYVNAEAVLAHFTGPVVGELVPKLLGTVNLDRFEVYGDPGEKAAAMLKGFGAEIFKHSGGFHRTSKESAASSGGKG
jgi:(4S)-4-hydroxy-5-phosphonooxypentane-2,3-dione isomerase